MPPITRTVRAALEARPPVPADRLESWLEPKLADLTPPDAMADRDAFTDRAAFAIKQGEKIAVFGDYDCDGITATAIMTTILRQLGGDVAPLLATRTEGAYGFSEPALERVRKSGAKLVVTCDCGSSDHPRIRAAADAGIDTLVIDHHLVPKEPLPARAFLNPHRPDCGFPFKWLASCGLALSVGAAMRKAMDKPLDLRPMLDLVAIGTIADVAPLIGDNRALVRAGLRVVAAGARPGIRALSDIARIQGGVGIVAEDVSFRIAPRLNAPGRLGEPDESLRLLLADDFQIASAIAASIEQVQLKRRALQAEMVEQALKDYEDAKMSERAGVVLARQGWHPGVVGIVAGRIADTTKKPTIVIGLEGENGRGSVRGPKDFPLYDALVLAKRELVGFGGHQAAAGVHARADRIEALAGAWDEACRELLPTVPPPGPPFVVELDPKDDPRDVVRDLLRLEPCGEGNPAPKLRLPRAFLASARDLKGHLKLEVDYGGRRLSGIAFGEGHRADQVNGGVRDLVGTLRPSAYSGVEFTATEIA